MVSCAPVANRRGAAISKRRQAGCQPAAGNQPAPWLPPVQPPRL